MDKKDLKNKIMLYTFYDEAHKSTMVLDKNKVMKYYNIEDNDLNDFITTNQTALKQALNVDAVTFNQL